MLLEPCICSECAERYEIAIFDYWCWNVSITIIGVIIISLSLSLSLHTVCRVSPCLNPNTNRLQSLTMCGDSGQFEGWSLVLVWVVGSVLYKPLIRVSKSTTILSATIPIQWHHNAMYCGKVCTVLCNARSDRHILYVAKCLRSIIFANFANEAHSRILLFANFYVRTYTVY